MGGRAGEAFLDFWVQTGSVGPGRCCGLALACENCGETALYWPTAQVALALTHLQASLKAKI